MPASATIDVIAPPNSTPLCAPLGPTSVSDLGAVEYTASFKQLANPTRIRIFDLLTASDQLIRLYDILDHIPLGQPSLPDRFCRRSVSHPRHLTLDV